jgi:uncharacterized membrane protein
MARTKKDLSANISIPNFVIAISAFTFLLYLLTKYKIENVFFPISVLFFAFSYFWYPFIIFLFFFFLSIFDVIKLEQTKKQYYDVYNNDFDKELYLKIFSK